jgi:hypothetical protein
MRFADVCPANRYCRRASLARDSGLEPEIRREEKISFPGAFVGRGAYNRPAQDPNWRWPAGAFPGEDLSFRATKNKMMTANILHSFLVQCKLPVVWLEK